MPQAIQQDYIDFATYLAGERDIAQRSEYIDGQIYAMAGASEIHNTITGDFYTHINLALPDECRVWQSDMKVIGKQRGKQFAYYPDIMAACGANTDDPYSRSNPLLIVEVLSNSTARTDLTEKRDNYTSIPSLLEYVVVVQNTPHVRIYRRTTQWQLESYYADDTLVLESVGLSLPVLQIYRRVKHELGLNT